MRMFERLLVSFLFLFALITCTSLSAQVRDSLPEKAAVSGQHSASATAVAGYDTAAASLYSQKMMENYDFYSQLALVIFLLWLVLIVVYYVWAIHRYNSNYGLSNEEWKILYPELYAKASKREEFKKRRAELEQRALATQATKTEQGAAGEPQGTDGGSLKEPSENPYKTDSFGLPPGTVRGTLALTLLVMVLLVEGVNYFAPTESGGLEGKYSELFTAFEMVLAFYFGARAVEVFKSSRQQKQPSTEKESAAGPPPQGPGKPVEPATAAQAAAPAPEAAPSEAPAVSENASLPRIVQLSETMRSIVPEIKPAPTGMPSLHQRILSLTASFETGLSSPECFGSVTGNFDGQGLSFGVLQCNINQGSLQPLWLKMREAHGDKLKEILGDNYDAFSKMLDSSKSDQMKWALDIQHTEIINGRTVWKFDADWLRRLHNLGISQEMIDIQVENASRRFEIAQANRKIFELSSDRALALMFDINVQNGKVDVKGAGARIRQDYMTIPLSLTGRAVEERKMEIIARRRAEVADPRWRSDVLARKLTIALGRGRVHGKDYDLVTEFNLASDPKA